MKRVTAVGLGFGLLGLALAGCATPVATGERQYREGDRLAALETWRSVSDDHVSYERARERIAIVEEEFQQLVVRYEQRGRYFEDKDRLAESILNYRLALKLQPDNAETLARVQKLSRAVASQRRELRARYRTDFDGGDLAKAGAWLERLRTLDPFDPELEADERELGSALRESVTRLLAAGRRDFSDGNHTAASRSFSAVIHLDPDNESARGYLSYIETIRQESQGPHPGRKSFDPGAYASDAKVRAEGFYQNALTAERKGKLYRAIGQDLRALGADAKHTAARRHLAGLRSQLANRVEGLIEMGRAQFLDEDLQSALDSWQRAVLVEPGNKRAQAYVARAQRQLANLERLRAEPDVANGRR